MSENTGIEIIKVDYSADAPTVLGRELHAALGVDSNYTTWINRMVEYGFSEGVDFIVCFPNLESDSRGGQNKVDHQLTIDMAKELCMIQRTDKGKECRQYFIDVERRWNDPASIMARALQLADRQISALKAVNAILLPKAEVFDVLADRNGLFNLRDTAKLIGVPAQAFVDALVDDGYLYRTQKKEIRFYANTNKGYFAVKEYVKYGHSGLQVMVTFRGREHFMRLYAKKLA